jgi:hypothetical protein
LSVNANPGVRGGNFGKIRREKIQIEKSKTAPRQLIQGGLWAGGKF